MTGQKQQLSVIVVGVDGTEQADDALRFAVDEARVSGDTVEVVTAWSIEPSPIAPEGVLGDLPSLDELAQAATMRQDAAVARVCGGSPDVTIARRVQRGDANVILVDAARNARMLVVGTRGHHRLRAALLGSTSRYVAHHAQCPVVVVPQFEHAPV